MTSRHSAGVLLFRRGADGLEVLLVHPGGPFWAKKDEGAWSIPKGEIEEGEDPRACALRELAEELGAEAAPVLAADGLLELGAIRQRAGKEVRAWAAEAEFDPSLLASSTFSIEWPPRSGSEQSFPEVDRAEWFGVEEARRRILPAQGELIERLMAALGG